MFIHISITCLRPDVNTTLKTMSDDGWELVAVIPTTRVTDDWDEDNDTYIARRMAYRELYFKKPAPKESQSTTKKDRPVPMNPSQQ